MIQALILFTIGLPWLGGLAVWITDRLQLAQAEVPLVLLASSFFAMLVGLFLMVTRRKAITQSLAYLVMENGVYAVGVSMNLEFPFIVELGILLDVFVGVFLMSNLLFHIDHEFDHLDGVLYIDKLFSKDTLRKVEAGTEEADDLKALADLSLGMVRTSIDAFVNQDPKLAMQVCQRDVEVDILDDEYILKKGSRCGEHLLEPSASLRVNQDTTRKLTEP